MKNLIKLIRVCIILTLIIQTSIAQNAKPREFPGVKSERKSEQETFTIIQQGDRLMIFNKSNTLMLQESRFEEMLGYGVSNPVKLFDKSKLDSLVYKKIMPFYRDFNSIKATDDICSFDIFLFSGLDGKLAEIVFSIDKEAKLPLIALEKLEKEILASNFKLDFDPNYSIIKGSKWVFCWCIYSVESMKKKLKDSEIKN